NQVAMIAFDQAVDRALADDAVNGVIIKSAKTDFIAGADLQMLLELNDTETIIALCDATKAIYRKVETADKLFVATINGTALGGGLELCLACHHRIVANNKKARIGLPEVQLGLFPSGGGTQRLPRMIGIEKALPVLLEGKHFSPAAALELGLVDEMVELDQLDTAARAWIALGANPNKPWYDKGYQPPEPSVQSPKGYEIFIGGSSRLHAKTRGNYPAPKAILSCVYEGMQVPIDIGMKVESKYFANLCLSKETRSMIRSLFFSMNEANKLGRRPQSIPVASYQRIGVLGAGMMGSGIAYASALAGLDVVLLDSSSALAEKGKNYSARVMDKLIARGQKTAQQKDQVLSRITITTDYSQLSDCELVVEAVFEDRKIKADVTGKTEVVLAPSAVFASNTSTLPISGLAEASSRPENFIGLHFFSPVDRMKLVEVIVGKETSDTCLAKALDFVKLIGKTPIVVNDSVGFYTSRLVSRFLDEGAAMIEEGVSPALIENAGKLAGFPVGPLALFDEVSLELSYMIQQQHRRDLGDQYETKPSEKVLDQLVKKLGRLGRKSGGGFYDYPADQPKHLWQGLNDCFPQVKQQPDVEEVKRRLLFVQSVDAVRCLDEGVLSDPRDGDVGSILGWGFPSYTGGAVSLVDYFGAETFVAECDRLAAAYGERFSPPQSLRDMARNEGAFYP
ncbi:MAG: 3-hydroxyacyl-CoA dehydrogenase/enoyl-CoA hydratase/3-hydroxybutyryl-CoA epimerase, partial [Gammaproteobacteria bacterium]